MSQFLSRTQIDGAISEEAIRTTLVMQLALMFSPIVFLFIVIILSQEPADQTADPDLLNIMTVIHLGFMFTAVIAQNIMFRRIFSPERIAADTSLSPEEVVRKGMRTLRTAIIVRMALLEGAAMFGIMVCLIAAISGLLAAEPVYWVNAVSTVFLLLVGVATLPTRERVVGWFEERTT